jgi:hypothetical protein
MARDRLAEAVPECEALRYTDDLRTGGGVGFTDERLLVARPDGAVTSVQLGDVDTVEFQDLDWFDVVLALALAGFGILSVRRNVLLGAGFVAAAAASLYLTYRKRTSVTVNLHSRPKPLTVYPADGSAFYDAFDRALSDYRERVDDETE